jgi:hypothetical protein
MCLIQIKHAQVKIHLFGLWTVHTAKNRLMRSIQCTSISCIANFYTVLPTQLCLTSLLTLSSHVLVYHYLF